MKNRIPIFLVLLVSACGAEPGTPAGNPADAAPPRCTPGTTVSCGCAGRGMVGVQTCGALGSYGACECGVDASAPEEAGSDVPVESAADAPSSARDAGGAPADEGTVLVDTMPVDAALPLPADASEMDAGVDATAVDSPDASSDAGDSSACPAGQVRCGDAGCRDLSSDPLNCSVCGVPALPVAPDLYHRVGACVNGMPTRVCERGWCVPGDGGVNLGCSVSTETGLPSAPLGINTYVFHCGACGRSCSAPLGSYARCTSGVCSWGCVQGRADCNGNPADGCEVLLHTSQANCGRCGNICPPNYRCDGTGNCRLL